MYIISKQEHFYFKYFSIICIKGLYIKYLNFFHRSILKLPHPSAIRNWNSTVDASPGFQRQVLNYLKNIPTEDKDCCLMFDGMAIRQQVIWDQEIHRFVGYCDYGWYKFRK